MPRTPIKKYPLTALKVPLAGQQKRRKIFEQVYAEKEWGDAGNEEFYSGGGSDEDMLLAYSNVVREFITQRQIQTVVDIGCGDFRAGRAGHVEGTRYIGIDIVPSLIERNQRDFSDSQVEFQCLDAVSDRLPDGDLCIIKQVLQHLSNAEIALILSEAKKYKYVIVTEHWPAPSPLFEPNKDKRPDGDIRASLHSGVYPHLPPFSYPDPQILLEAAHTWPDSSSGESIVTMMFENLN